MSEEGSNQEVASGIHIPVKPCQDRLDNFTSHGIPISLTQDQSVNNGRPFNKGRDPTIQGLGCDPITNDHLMTIHKDSHKDGTKS